MNNLFHKVTTNEHPWNHFRRFVQSHFFLHLIKLDIKTIIASWPAKPFCQHLAGHFFGRNATPLDVYDVYGANLSSEPLPGRGHSTQHSSLQHLMQDMMRLGKIVSVLEPVNFVLGKVGQPFIGDYVHNITSQPGNPRHARHAIVPDIQATNYPSGGQVVTDSGATRSADAIFEVKTFTSCNTRYNHNNRNINPANRHARE